MNTLSDIRLNNRLYVARQSEAAVTKTANTAKTSSFQTVLKDNLYADRATAGDTTSAQAFAPNTSLRWRITGSELGKMLDAAGDSVERKTQIMNKYDSEISERMKGTLQVPIVRNELVSFMEEVERGLENGESFSDIVQKWNDKKVREFYSDDDVTGLGNSLADLIFVDPDTGEVKHATTKLRQFYDNQDIIDGDDDAVWDLAYDLQQFLNARVFRNENVVSDDEANKIVAEVKARQANKDYGRFDRPFGSVGYQGRVDMNTNVRVELSEARRRYYEKLGVSGVGGGALIDDFMSRIGKHSDI